ncbi:MAG: metallophosphoesterase [Kofleriaceae bacterium]
MRVALSLLVFITACGGNPGDGAPADGAIGTIDGAPAPPDAAPPRRVRFIAVGDAGKGNAAQYAVAEAMRGVCAERGCDFVILLGDNIYEAGVDSTVDSQWQTKFEQPYADLDLPFYAALGNHDYGGRLLTLDLPGIGNEWVRGVTEVEYSQVSSKWTMPATHYTFAMDHVGFIVLDTNSIIWDDTTHGDQAAWLPTAFAELEGRDWVFLVGHHPYRSNGTHGNAGDYDAPELAGVTLPNPLPIQDGEHVKDFFDAHLCGVADVYFAGQHHSRAFIARRAGAAPSFGSVGRRRVDHRSRIAATSCLRGRQRARFFYVDADGDTFTGAFYDRAGHLDFTRTFQRAP